MNLVLDILFAVVSPEVVFSPEVEETGVINEGAILSYRQVEYDNLSTLILHNEEGNNQRTY